MNSAAARPVIIDPATLFDGDPSGLEKANIEAFSGLEAQVLRYKAGQQIPMHSHTNPTMKVVLSGCLQLVDEEGPIGKVRAGDIYPCGTSPYAVTALENTLMLLLQPPRTERVNV